MKQQQGGIYTIIVWFLVIYLGGTSILYSRYIIFFIGALLLVTHIFSNKGFNRGIINLLIIWISINILAMVFLRSGFVFFRIIIMTVNLLLFPYVLLKGMGLSFWDRFERIVFLLTAISLPLYLLNILFQDFFNSLTSVFEPITNTSLAGNVNYWSALIYVNAFGDNYYGLVRNSGFMWEPGGFALMIVWALVYNWLTKGASFNRRSIIYLIALLTTFSTAGYFAMFFIFSAFYIKKVSFFNVTFLIVVASVFYFYIYRLDFMAGKIDKYASAYDDNNINIKSGQEIIKVNRFQGGYHALLKTFKYPLGYGLVSEKDFTEETAVYGTNGLASLLVMWGIPAFIYLMFLLWRYFKVFNYFNVNKITLTLLYLALLVMFFSNPISRYIFIYIILITPLIFKRQELENSYKQELQG